MENQILAYGDYVKTPSCLVCIIIFSTKNISPHVKMILSWRKIAHAHEKNGSRNIYIYIYIKELCSHRIRFIHILTNTNVFTLVVVDVYVSFFTFISLKMKDCLTL